MLARELEGLGFDRFYPTLVREIRGLGLRPACQCCRSGTVLTVADSHELGEELQLDWLELHETPRARKAYVLASALSSPSPCATRSIRAPVGSTAGALCA